MRNVFVRNKVGLHPASRKETFPAFSLSTASKNVVLPERRGTKMRGHHLTAKRNTGERCEASRHAKGFELRGNVSCQLK
jgi:hypothetical protein